MSACAEHLARAWLLARLAGHLDRERAHVGELLALEDGDLIAAVGGGQGRRLAAERAAFIPAAARAAADAAGLSLVCRCRRRYPPALRALAAPPAVLHVLGDPERLTGAPAVALVGARRPSPYGTEMARSLGRGVAAAGLTVVSGMAAGIDSAAHRGALDAGAATVAVLAGAPERAYPRAARALHRAIAARGAVVSELPPGTAPRRWMFPARNRIIAALAGVTVVVEGRAHSGALITAAWAAQLGRPVGAIPGHATSPLARGPHRLLGEGAHLIQDAADVLELLLGPDPVTRQPPAAASGLDPPARRLLEALAEGHPAPSALERAGLDAETGLAALAALELAGRIRRGPGGHFVVAAS